VSNPNHPDSNNNSRPDNDPQPDQPDDQPPADAGQPAARDGKLIQFPTPPAAFPHPGRGGEPRAAGARW
jgi:hypothetical protein